MKDIQKFKYNLKMLSALFRLKSPSLSRGVVYCTHLPKSKVAAKLYNNAKMSDIHSQLYENKDMTEDEADKILKTRDSYWGVVKARRVHVSFSFYPKLDEDDYDEANGIGAMRKCISDLCKDERH